MKCQKYIALMSEYLEGEMKPDIRSLWEKHFDSCGECHDFFHSFKSSVELINYLKKEKCPDKIKARLEHMIVEMAEQKSREISH